ncbi:MAG: hypothetical protein LBI40_01735, partial [Treponema sp.]|nr:hypothetical protein [Treponema sp.]
MGKKTDWMSGTRSGQLATAKNWVMILKDKGKVWNVLADETTELTSLTDDADEALAVAKNETTRTPVATAQCRTAFDALTAKMRDIKKRYFYVPPLTQADLVSLGLHPHDATPSHSGIPTAQVMVETYLIGRHELGVHIVYVAGDPNDKANKGYRIWYAVVAPGETPPVDPE